MMKDGKSINTIYFGGEKFVSLKDGEYVKKLIGRTGVLNFDHDSERLYSSPDESSDTTFVFNRNTMYNYTIDGFYSNFYHVEVEKSFPQDHDGIYDSGSGWITDDLV